MFIREIVKPETFGGKKMEETKNLAIHDFETDYSVAVAAFTAPDENFKYAVMDDADSDIKTIAVIVWYDEDSDNILDAGENNIRFDTKVVQR